MGGGGGGGPTAEEEAASLGAGGANKEALAWLDSTLAQFNESYLGPCPQQSLLCQSRRRRRPRLQCLQHGCCVMLRVPVAQPPTTNASNAPPAR